MKDDNKTKKQLIGELAELRKKLSEPEAPGGTSMPAGKDLRAQGARNELILRTTHDGFWVVGLDGNLIEVNDSYCRMVGYSRDELLSMNVAELDANEDPEAVKSHIEKILREGEDRFETRHRRKDGNLIDLQANVKLAESGGESFLFTFLKDITENKRAEEKLKTSEENFRNVFENSASGMVLVDTDGRFMRVNAAMCKIVGCSEKELLGKMFNDITHPDDLGLGSGYLKSILAGEIDTACFEKRYINKAGDTVWVSIVTTLLRDVNSEPLYIISQINDITERKLAEEALKKVNEELLLQSEIISRMTEGVYLVRMDGIIVYTNPKFEQMFGYEPGEMIGKHASIVNYPTERNPEETAREILEILDKTGVWLGEIQNVKKDGTPFWSHASVVVFDHSKHGRVLVAVHNDITERKRAEEALKRAYDEMEERVKERTREISEEVAERKLAEAELKLLSQRYEAILKAVPDIVVEVDANKIYIWANQAGHEFFGEGVIGTEASCYFEGEQETYSVVEPLFSGEEDVIYLESWQRRKDKETRLLAWWCRVLKDENGNVIGALSTARDITERKRADEALKESESLFKQLVETTSAIVWEVDMATLKFNYVSPQALEITGYTPEEWIDFDFWASLIHPDDRKSSVDFCQLKTAKLEDHEFEYRLITKDNRVVWLREIVKIIAGEEGTKCLRGFMIDITERKKIEAELLKVQKLESVGILAGGIAHDFNNIITGILGNISLAKIYSSPEGKAFERLIEAENAVGHATRLAQQLLTFSKGGKPIKETAYARNLIKDSVSFSLSGSNIRCEYSICEDLWPVDMDTGQINQVISNLAINARYAVPEGGVLKVGAENMTTGTDKEDAMGGLLKEGRYIRISVKDNGTGIDRENLDKIFDPYFSTKEGGSGLGLATSYSIIKKHGGYITVESQPGVGTTFHIYLRASEELPRGKGRGELTTSLKERKQKGMKVLVMDDEEIIRDVSGEMLTSLGYEVNFATDGNEAIELYRKAKESGEPFDVVIMDLTIPGGMGGKEAIKKLLELDPGAKVIVSSGYSNDPVMSGYKEYGFRGVIAKPYKLVELSAKVHKVIAGED